MKHTIVDTEWEETTATQEAAPLARRSNYVPAMRHTVVQPPQPVQPDEYAVPQPVWTHVSMVDTYEGRSRGFLVAIAPVAAVTGVLSCVVGVTLFGVPLVSAGVLVWFSVAFCLVWLAGFALHLAASPDGAVFFCTWQLWRTVQNEQQFRHERYWRQYEDSRRDAGLEDTRREGGK